MKKQLLALGLGTVMAFGLVGCGEKTVSTQDAYDKLNNALEMTLTENTKEFSLTAKTTVEVRSYKEDEEDESEIIETSEKVLETVKMTVDLGFQFKLGEDDKVSDLALWLKAIPEAVEGETTEEKSLIFEGYRTNGYTYSYVNLFGDNYNYEEVEEGDEIDFSDMGDIVAQVKEYEQMMPDPTATVKKDEYKLSWTVTNENLIDYAKIYFAVMGGSGDMTDEEMQEEINEITEEFKIEECKIEVLVKNDKFTKFNMNVNVNDGGEQYARTSFTIEAKYENIGEMFDTARLEEIKAEYKKAHPDPVPQPQLD